MSKELSSELEKQFCGLKNVRSAHIDFDNTGEVVAIGIFSDNLRNPKDIKRDVEETFRQVAGYRINHMKISIIEQQLEKEIFSAEKRIRFLTAYQIQRHNNVIEGIVQVEYNEQKIIGSVEANLFEMETEYIIANATVQALMNILTEHNLRVDNVKELKMGSVDVIVVTITMIHKPSGVKHIFVGSVIKSKDLLSSVAKATLDSINRRMDQVI
ncbi:MAG: hypothetical protein AB7V16_00375 [Vulcanibacillus sp.]